MSNLNRLRQAMEQASIPALLVTDNVNLRWLTGFTGSSGIALVTQNHAGFVTDARYDLWSRSEVIDHEITIYQRPRTLDDLIAEVATKFQAQEIAFEGSTSYSAWKARTEKLSDFSWIDSPDLIRDLRKIKTVDEINRIRAACKLADACIENITRMIQPGITEYDISLDIEFFYRRNGAEIAFDPIVASGPNSARPHATPSERKLEVGDFVTIDCGGKLDGYCSDITRTFVVGKASDRQVEIYNQVLKSEIACCAALKSGANGKDIDALAREILDEIDLNQYFTHGLGHGLGLDVHDPGGLSSTVDQPIEPGMVFTVEPGVYIEGFGGLRIEDDVLVTDSEPEILTLFPKELMIL